MGYWPQTGEVRINGMIAVSPNSGVFPYIEKRQIPQLCYMEEPGMMAGSVSLTLLPVAFVH